MDGYAFHCPGCQKYRSDTFDPGHSVNGCYCSICYGVAPHWKRRPKWKREVDTRTGVCPGCLAKQACMAGGAAFDMAAYTSAIDSIRSAWINKGGSAEDTQRRRDALVQLGRSVVHGSFADVST